ncbi:uncharacterized protein LOC119275624 isoform X2 [Triticum dicoccoides]|uniref:uncharacterized protein LOC119275624 isoform X2 n=1 Tax=Triticum dicoccoides TaxID=85692 RepID=UPI00188F9F85|nr:uncharacterized protein LOC119275624 isoform X2 [Triticum dicoccoides]
MRRMGPPRPPATATSRAVQGWVPLEVICKCATSHDGFFSWWGFGLKVEALLQSHSKSQEIWQQIYLRKEYEHHFCRCTPGLSWISGNEHFLFKIHLQNQLIEGPYVELLFKNLLMTVCRTAASLQGLLAVTLLAILLKIGWPLCRYFICGAVRLGTEAGAFPQGKSSFIGRSYVVDVTISCIFLR